MITYGTRVRLNAEIPNFASAGHEGVALGWMKSMFPGCDSLRVIFIDFGPRFNGHRGPEEQYIDTPTGWWVLAEKLEEVSAEEEEIF